MLKEIQITQGVHKGRTGTLIEEGTFKVFDRTVIGAKVHIGGAGAKVVPNGAYIITGEKAEDMSNVCVLI